MVVAFTVLPEESTALQRTVISEVAAGTVAVFNVAEFPMTVNMPADAPNAYMRSARAGSAEIVTMSPAFICLGFTLQTRGTVS